MSSSFAFSKDLFKAYNGSSMNFHVSRCQNDEELEEYIKYGGGLVRRSPGPFTIIIEDDREESSTENQDSFLSDYIIQCCTQNKILSLKQFRCNSTSLFSTEFNPNDILHQKISWIDAMRQFKMASKDKDSVESSSENEEQHNHTNSRWRTSRTEFTHLERKKIVEFIVQTKSFTEVRGTALWKRMQQKFKNHTWQSLKEHFLKKIMPLIHTYNLTPAEVSYFRSAAKVQVPMKTKRSNKSSSYSSKEDNLILKYVSKHAKPTTSLGGNEFWKKMQENSCVPGRTWQSVRERYLKFLRNKKPYKNTQSESEEDNASISSAESTLSSPKGPSPQASKKSNVPPTSGESSTSAPKKIVSSTPGVLSPSTSKNKRVSSTSVGEPTSVGESTSPRVCKENAVNVEDELQSPPKRLKRKLFSRGNPIPDFSPITVSSNPPSWLEKQFNNPQSKRLPKLTKIILNEIENENDNASPPSNCLLETARQSRVEELSETEQVSLLTKVDIQEGEDVQDLASVDLFASSSINQLSAPSQEEAKENNNVQETSRGNRKTSECQQIPPPHANTQNNGNEDRQISSSMDVFASSSNNENSTSSKGNGKKSLNPSSSSNSDQENWSSNFPPEQVLFISDCESDPANKSSDEDARASEDHEDSEWSDDGLFWRGGIELPDRDGLKRALTDPVAHLTTVRMMELDPYPKINGEHLEIRSPERQKAQMTDKVEAKKQDFLESKTKGHPKVTATVDKPLSGTSRNVTFNFLPGLNNSYDESQNSIIDGIETEEFNSQTYFSEPIVTASQDYSQQNSNSCPQATNTEESHILNSCDGPINDNFESVGEQIRRSNRRHVAVQTDPVIVLPMNWKSQLSSLLPASSLTTEGCPSPVPANGSFCSDIDD